MVWDNGATFPDPDGVSIALKSPDLDNNGGSKWCTATASNGDGSRGTPSSANDCILAVYEIHGRGTASFTLATR